jgi:hypothetical protein
MNVWHYNDSTGSIAQCNAAITVLKSFYDALNICYTVTSQATIGATVLDISVDPPAFVPATPLTSAGTAANNQLPAQLAFVISWKTVFAGPSFRGRTYIGPTVTSAVGTDGLPIAGAVTALNTASNLIVTHTSGRPPNEGFVVYSQYHGKNPDGSPKKRTTPVASGIVGKVVRNKMYTQRRRSS